MIAWTVQNPLNYYISTTVAPSQFHYQNDTLVVRLGGLFSQNATCNLSIKHLLSTNMAFLNDTVVSFKYTYPVEQKPLLSWTFDNLQAKPNTPLKIFADYHLLDTVSEAVLYCDGTYQSSVWLQNTELDALNGTTTGDPRPNPRAGKAIAFVNKSANEKTVVFKFPTKGYFNLSFSLAVQRTATGCDSHEWEWSVDGENYNFIEYTHTCPLVTGSFVLTTLDLRDIDELNDQNEVFLRLKFDGATGATGNNRLDNITLHGVPIHHIHVEELIKKSNQFHIVPNPTQGQFQITLNNLTHFMNTDYVIYNSMGQVVKTGKSIENTIIDIGNQPNGLYLIMIEGECLKILKY
jgi:hypothetical protein